MRDGRAGGEAGADGMSFEAAMARLEHLVRELEEGNLSLDQSIRSFEEGMDLVRRCASELRRAEERVKRLTEEAGRLLVEDMAELDAGDAGTRSTPGAPEDDVPF